MAIRELTMDRRGRGRHRPRPDRARAGDAGQPRRHQRRGLGAPRRVRLRRASSTSRCTATTTSTCGCCAGHRRTTPAGTTTTSPRAPWRSWRASCVENNLTLTEGARERRVGGGTSFSFGPDHIHRLNGAVHGIGLGARLQPAAVADGPVPRRRRRHPQAGLAVLRRRAAPDLTRIPTGSDVTMPRSREAAGHRPGHRKDDQVRVTWC